MLQITPNFKLECKRERLEKNVMHKIFILIDSNLSYIQFINNPYNDEIVSIENYCLSTNIIISRQIVVDNIQFSCSEPVFQRRKS